VGGHCIAVDPWFLVEAAPEQACLIRQARHVNDGMPEHVVNKVNELVAGLPHPAIACLGLTFKADVDDTRESPAVEIVERLIQAGYAVRAYDPHAKSIPKFEGNTANTLDRALDGADLAVLLVDHAEFRQLLPDAGHPLPRTILDTRHCLNRVEWARHGVRVEYLGAGK
jgi:UDP-N-acetyl-D-mannosaminuronic acid dehydrogenase